jgi:DNA-directed RNA polymerase specialized sigma24 family protein
VAHYVDNKEFYKALVEYGKDVRRAKRNGMEKPDVTEYLGGCILQISQHLAFKPNFANYSFKDEMISDAVENCLKYIGNFNPKKSTNPFAYFTQIAYYAFIRRIHKEKRVAVTKQKYIENLDIHDLVMIRGDESQYANAILANMRQHADQLPTIPVPEIPDKYRRKPKYLSEGEDDDIVEETH